MRRLWGYLRPYWHLEVLTFLDMVVLAGLALAMPAAVRYMIDDMLPSLVADPRLSVVLVFGLVLLGIYCANVMFGWVRDYLAAYIGARIIADIRSQLFYHLELLSLSFYQKHRVGEMMSRLLSDVNRVQNLLTSTLLTFLTSILMLVAIVIYLVNVNWMLTLVAVVPLPLTVVLTNRFGNRLHWLSRRLQESIAGLSARIQESFLSIKTIKAFGQERQEREKVNSVLSELSGLYVKNSVTRSLSVNLVNLVNMIGPIVVLAWGVYLVAGGGMKLGALIAFYMLLTYLFSPIQNIASAHIEVRSATASVNRIYEYLDIPPGVVEASHPVSIRRPVGEIEFENVSFSYQESSFRIQNFNLDIRPRETVALVGPSGSGKTTIINLIMRFYDPESGRIMLDGIDLRQLAIRSLRENFALVDQDPLLFKTTVFNNIAYAVPDARPDQVIRAARIANIHNFVSGLPDQYQSMVGERGVTLSGGEKQRLCLARAVLKDPAVLILDEATSALDSSSERLIQEALRDILTNKTAIIIAHRLSTVQHADRIIALDNGRIADQGTHQQLLETSPLYRELAEKQLKI